MTNYLKTHKFEGSGESEDTRTELCLCGLPEDNPLHLVEKDCPDCLPYDRCAKHYKMKNTMKTRTTDKQLLEGVEVMFEREIFPELKYYGTKAVALLIKMFIARELTALASRVREETAEDICLLLDDIELRASTQGTDTTESCKNKTLWKHIRNAIRDKYMTKNKGQNISREKQ